MFCQCGTRAKWWIKARTSGGRKRRVVRAAVCPRHFDLIFDIRASDFLGVEFIREGDEEGGRSGYGGYGEGVSHDRSEEDGTVAA